MPETKPAARADHSWGAVSAQSARNMDDCAASLALGGAVAGAVVGLLLGIFVWGEWLVSMIVVSFLGVAAGGLVGLLFAVFGNWRRRRLSQASAG